MINKAVFAGLVVGIFVLCFWAKVPAQEWTNIIPLTTKCKDLKKILGVKKCKFPVSNYEFETFDLNINFLTKNDKLKVSFDTVVEARISLKKLIRLRDFETDLSDYKINAVDDLPSTKVYKNEKRGISLTVQPIPELNNEEYIKSIWLYPYKAKNK
jgi:hypothetical protein